MRGFFLGRILSLLLALITGCGTLSGGKYNGRTWIDPELHGVMDDWAKTCAQYLEPSRCNTQGIERIVLVDEYKDNPNIMGQCVVSWENFQEIRRVTISRDIPRDGYFIKAVMLHEMMHCRMGFERHEDVGLMGAYLRYGEKTLEDKWLELLEETYALVR